MPHDCAQCYKPIPPGLEVEVGDLLFHKACAPHGRLIWSDDEGIIEVWDPEEDGDPIQPGDHLFIDEADAY